jgi:hypothetical protein
MKIEARLPKGKVIQRFIPNRDFYAEEVKSHYAAGYVYYVREGNDALARLVRAWVDENLVTLA